MNELLIWFPSLVGVAIILGSTRMLKKWNVSRVWIKQVIAIILGLGGAILLLIASYSLERETGIPALVFILGQLPVYFLVRWVFHKVRKKG